MIASLIALSAREHSYRERDPLVTPTMNLNHANSIIVKHSYFFHTQSIAILQSYQYS